MGGEQTTLSVEESSLSLKTPATISAIQNDGKESNNRVDFNNGDPTNPLNWSSRHKSVIIILISAIELLTMLGTIMCAPNAPQILDEFHSDSTLYQTLLVSIWELGEVVGSFIAAPLSELYGRFYIYHVGNVLFCIFSIACALSTNVHMLIAFRFLNGAAVVTVVLNPSIVSDLYPVEQRGRALAITGFGPLIGPVIGPIVGSYLGETAGWRWTFWLMAILSGVCEVLLVIFFRETYKVRILQQTAARIREETGDESVRSKYEVDDSGKRTMKETMKEAFIRPMQMLLFSPALILLSFYVAVVYGYMYLIMTTITMVFEGVYGFSEGASGLSFLGLSIGFLFGIFLCHFTLDLWVAHKSAAGQTQPEQRLPPVAFGGIIIPIGLFVYGWTAENGVHWIVPIIAMGVLGMGIVATTIPASSYLVDAYGIYAASAMAASAALRNISGAVFPLAGPPLYDRLGLGWGNSLLGFIALGFIPMPLLMMRYGGRLRFLDKRKIEH
ncbi:hypothetical protein NHQ30_004741 [Ciborinia camelliae]|nr:hypothetical protein NHQ30_004741 [Ciborinia camelliae]